MATPSEPDDATRRWTEALREFDVLEPWLTESHWDDRYWDDVAARVVAEVGRLCDMDEATSALRRALRATFPGADLRSDNGVYRDQLDERLRLISCRALEGG